MENPSRRSYRLFITFSSLAALYVFSMFYRVSTAVISPNLMHDLNLDPEALGVLGGAFFYSFALLQIPMGPMLDRIGPRAVLLTFPFIGAIGSFLFAAGTSFTAVLVGRTLIGAGMSCVLMGSLKIFTLRFPPNRFATLTGLILSAGMLGSIIGASPLAYVTSAVGWRTIFLLTGGVTALLALLVYWVLGEDGPGKGSSLPAPNPKPEFGVLESMRLVVGSLAFWQLGAVAFFRHGTTIALQGLWLGPYLIYIKGYSPVQTGNVLIMMALGTVVGSPIAGRLSDRTLLSSKAAALIGFTLYSLGLFSLTGILDIRSPFYYGVILFSIGFFAGFGVVLFAHTKELFPIAISGTALTLVNFFTMAGAAVLMPVIGMIIKSFPKAGESYPAEAYHLSFLICFLSMAASLVFYAFSKKKA